MTQGLPPGTSESGTVELQLDADTDQNAKPGWFSGAYLPHFDADNLIQHVTFHLADSLPKSALHQLELSIEEMPEDERKQRRREKFQILLDAGHGSCVLGEPCAAKIVQDALFHFDGERYRLLAWVIMPNHIHVLLVLQPGFLLARVVQSWKSFTARRINGWLEETGRRAGARPSQGKGGTPLWQRDYWDRFIRDERHYLAAVRYIEENPVAAGLANRADDWPWGSAPVRCENERTKGEAKKKVPKDACRATLPLVRDCGRSKDHGGKG